MENSSFAFENWFYVRMFPDIISDDIFRSELANRGVREGASGASYHPALHDAVDAAP